MIENMNWIKVNQNLLAKAIGELTFEQVLAPSHSSDGFELQLGSGINYTFKGQFTVWEYLRVDASTLRRNNEPVTNAGQFFIDSQIETQMDDIVLGNFLEEMHNTLHADLIIHSNNEKLSIEKVAQLDGEKIQTLLNGHPKFLLNKGRIGWNSSDMSKYAPEANHSFKLHWVAINNSLLNEPVPTELLDSSMDQATKESLLSIIPKDYSILPVHPWQWDRYISIQFAPLLATNGLISLGVAGDHYRPQISIRTLSNVTRPQELDIKLPLTILNTSAIRGLSVESINKGKAVSETLKQICNDDLILRQAGLEILLEKKGAAFVHNTYLQVKNAPYRYHELIGAIWRESSRSKLANDEQAILSSALFHKDLDDKSLIGEYIRLSGLSADQWMNLYFKHIVVPLYHLQVAYGVGMVAHGQNIILKLKDKKPVGMFLKDFQGDLRLVDQLPEAAQEYFKESGTHLTRLPKHYLIHDLITGHFVTNLRFISAVLNEEKLLNENEFYRILGQVIQDYLSDKKVDKEIDLLTPTFSRVLINKVRFKIGYADSSQRPLPMLGSELKNPLSIVREKSII